MTLAETLTRGWPIAIELGETLPGPPEVVWDLITDWERQGDWMLEASDFKVVSEVREGVGVEAEATIRIGGLKTRDRVRVVGWEPRHRLAIEHLGWVRGTGELHLTPLGKDRTHLFWREELEPPVGMLGTLGLVAFKPLMRKQFARDLKVLALLVASRVKSPSDSRTGGR